MSRPKSVDLPANLTISTAEALYEKFEALLLEDCDINVNAKAVERVDTAGLQLLYVFKDALSKRNLTMKWKSTSESLIEAATQIGLSEKLELAK